LRRQEVEMQERKNPLTGLTLSLDILATLLLLFILVGFWIYRTELFVIGNPINRVGLIMMGGFIAILVFNISSILWLGRSLFEGGEKKALNMGLLVFGIVCLVLLAAEKVMTDEVAHETVGGWTIQGEYIMLYGMLVIQLLFNILMAKRLLGTLRVNRERLEAIA
jgi:hypothetical protein